MKLLLLVLLTISATNGCNYNNEDTGGLKYAYPPDVEKEEKTDYYYKHLDRYKEILKWDWVNYTCSHTADLSRCRLMDYCYLSRIYSVKMENGACIVGDDFIDVCSSGISHENMSGDLIFKRDGYFKTKSGLMFVGDKPLGWNHCREPRLKFRLPPECRCSGQEIIEILDNKISKNSKSEVIPGSLR